MSFARNLLEKAQPYLDAQVQKPFLQGLLNGDLPVDSFEYWLKVDYPYLVNLIKVVSLGVVKADDPHDMWVMLEHVKAIQREMQDHEAHAERLGLSHADLLSYRMGPLKYSYTRHQLATAYHGTLAEIQAAILPCQWGYDEAARTLVKQKPVGPDHPYKSWFDFHTAEENLEDLEHSLDLLDRHVARSSETQLAKIEEAFLVSLFHETMLWDEYYNKVTWETY
jgi:thiaminase/transcriptional activator TenA